MVPQNFKRSESFRCWNPIPYMDFLMGPGNCGTDMILCLDDSHSFKLTMGVGSGTNNFDELLALWRLYGLQKKGMLSSFLFLATQRS